MTTAKTPLRFYLVEATIEMMVLAESEGDARNTAASALSHGEESIDPSIIRVKPPYRKAVGYNSDCLPHVQTGFKNEKTVGQLMDEQEIWIDEDEDEEDED